MQLLDGCMVRLVPLGFFVMLLAVEAIASYEFVLE